MRRVPCWCVVGDEQNGPRIFIFGDFDRDAKHRPFGFQCRRPSDEHDATAV